MKWRAAAAITCVACGVVSTDAVQLTLDRRALDEAINIASRIPGAKKGTVEIRPVLEIPNIPTPGEAQLAAAT